MSFSSSLLFGDFTEDYSLEDSLSDSSKELLHKGRGEASIYTIYFWLGNTCNQAFKKLLLITKKKISQFNDFSAFLI